MANEKRLISGLLLSSRSFREDLKTFLDLSPTQLHQLSSIANSRGGLSAEQTITFSQQASLDMSAARASLGVAEYLYEKCRDECILPEAAVAELVELAPKVGIEGISGKEAALRDLLAPKDGYEAGRYAVTRGTAVVAHFGDIDGVWDIRPVFHRDTAKIVSKVPVLLLNVSWHDTTRTQHDAVFQLDEEDWTTLRQKIEQLQRQWETLREEMQGR